MTKYYCGMLGLVLFDTLWFCLDYCDIFLTHDAPRVRKDHNAGWKHAVQVRAHYLGIHCFSSLPITNISADSHEPGQDAAHNRRNRTGL